MSERQRREHAESGGEWLDRLDRLERALRELARGLWALPRRAAGSSPAAASGLDRAAYFLLGEMHRHGPARVSELAGALSLDVSTVSRQLHELEALGLVTRHPDPVDGRAVRLEVSDEGAAELAEARAAKQRFLERALAALEPVEQEALLASLERIAAAIAKEAAGETVGARA